jgi:glycerol kinase
MGAPASLDAIDRLCRRSAGDTQLLPSFWGLGSAYTAMRDSTLPGVMVSTGGPVTQADLTRAGVEAIANMVAVVLERGSGENRSVRRLVATGSLAGLPYLMEFQAALLAGIAVGAGAEPEATLSGAAQAAAASAGITWRHKRGGRPRSIATTPRERRLAQHRHREWRRLIAMARIWKEVAEAYP